MNSHSPLASAATSFRNSTYAFSHVWTPSPTPNHSSRANNPTNHLSNHFTSNKTATSSTKSATTSATGQSSSLYSYMPNEPVASHPHVTSTNQQSRFSFASALASPSVPSFISASADLSTSDSLNSPPNLAPLHTSQFHAQGAYLTFDHHVSSSINMFHNSSSTSAYAVGSPRLPVAYYKEASNFFTPPQSPKPWKSDYRLPGLATTRTSKFDPPILPPLASERAKGVTIGAIKDLMIDFPEYEEQFGGGDGDVGYGRMGESDEINDSDVGNLYGQQLDVEMNLLSPASSTSTIVLLPRTKWSEGDLEDEGIMTAEDIADAVDGDLSAVDSWPYQDYTPEMDKEQKEELIDGITTILESTILVNDNKLGTDFMAHGTGYISSQYEDGAAGDFYSLFRPSLSLRGYVERLVKLLDMDRSSFIVSLIYLDRVRRADAAMAVNSLTVHRLLLTASLLGMKYQEDEPYWDNDIAEIGGLPFGRKELKKLEETMFMRLGDDCWVDGEQFRKYELAVVKRGRRVRSVVKANEVFRAAQRELGLVADGTNGDGSISLSARNEYGAGNVAVYRNSIVGTNSSSGDFVSFDVGAVGIGALSPGQIYSGGVVRR